MVKRLYQFSLNAMEKLDKRNNAFEKLGYKFARKIYDKSFVMLYDASPYDYNRWYGDDE